MMHPRRPTQSKMKPSRPQVAGTLTHDGRVLCTCGKRAGGVEKNHAVFACQCGNLVTIDSDLYFLKTCEEAIQTCNKALEQMKRVIDLLEKSRQQ